MNGDDVAVKIEHKMRHTLMQLPHEQRIYQILRGSTSLGHSVGFPQMLFYGESPTMNILVMQLLGSTLEDVFNYCNKKFSLKTIIMIFDQLISRIGNGFISTKIATENCHRKLPPKITVNFYEFPHGNESDKEYVHNKGFVHRDIKPANILLAYSGVSFTE